jgi:hypothetical protein
LQLARIAHAAAVELVRVGLHLGAQLLELEVEVALCGAGLAQRRVGGVALLGHGLQRGAVAPGLGDAGPARPQLVQRAVDLL